MGGPWDSAKGLLTSVVIVSMLFEAAYVTHTNKETVK